MISKSDAEKLRQFITSRPRRPVDPDVNHVCGLIASRVSSFEEASVLYQWVYDRSAGRDLSAKSVASALAEVSVSQLRSKGNRFRGCPECRDHPGWKYQLYRVEYLEGEIKLVSKVYDDQNPGDEYEIGRKCVVFAVEKCRCQEKRKSG